MARNSAITDYQNIGIDDIKNEICEKFIPIEENSIPETYLIKKEQEDIKHNFIGKSEFKNTDMIDPSTIKIEEEFIENTENIKAECKYEETPQNSNLFPLEQVFLKIETDLLDTREIQQEDMPMIDIEFENKVNLDKEMPVTINGPSSSSIKTDKSRDSQGALQLEKKYSCHLCRHFKTDFKNVLLEHKEVQHKYCKISRLDLTYECKKCNLKFSEFDTLETHFKNHQRNLYRKKGAFPKESASFLCCDKCEYQTKRFIYFKKHQMTHENKTVWQCSMCDYVALQSRQFREHLRDKHGVGHRKA